MYCKTLKTFALTASVVHTTIYGREENSSHYSSRIPCILLIGNSLDKHGAKYVGYYVKPQHSTMGFMPWYRDGIGVGVRVGVGVGNSVSLQKVKPNTIPVGLSEEA